ncbi:hypothetical protein CEE44_04970 [Candidatus Woesearchaeota archaeon B3_Woes]|nr:MAG: hypothetical protein CEE44_04970 [Candidatus Woesearchaeota archaeon B3_Woes]
METNQTQEEQTLTLAEITAQLDNTQHNLDCGGWGYMSERERFLIAFAGEIITKHTTSSVSMDVQGFQQDSEFSEIIDLMIEDENPKREYLTFAEIEADRIMNIDPKRAEEMYTYISNTVINGFDHDFEKVLRGTTSEDTIDKVVKNIKEKANTLSLSNEIDAQDERQIFRASLSTVAQGYKRINADKKAVTLFKEIYESLIAEPTKRQSYLAHLREALIGIKTNPTNRKWVEKKVIKHTQEIINDGQYTNPYTKAIFFAKNIHPEYANKIAQEGIDNVNNDVSSYDKIHCLKHLELEIDVQTVEERKKDDVQNSLYELIISATHLSERIFMKYTDSLAERFLTDAEKLISNGYKSKVIEAVDVVVSKEKRQTKPDRNKGEFLLQALEITGEDKYLPQAMTAFQEEMKYEKALEIATQIGDIEHQKLYDALIKTGIAKTSLYFSI